MTSIGEMFADFAAQLLKASKHSGKVTPRTVYQAANLHNRSIVQKAISVLLLPGSRIENVQALLEFGELSKKGASCLILMEHYSNFDIPNFYHLMSQAGDEAAKVADQVISIAGMKLNEEHELVSAATEAYGRIVIYPSRSLNALREKGESAAEEISRARAINMAALHEMVRAKHAGHIILVFPSGTRYRPGDAESKRGLKEIDSYIKSFDYILFVGIAGNTLRITGESQSMIDDTLANDIVIFLADEIVDAQEFRRVSRERAPEGSDLKQAVADAVMERLDALHEKAEIVRSEALGQ